MPELLKLILIDVMFVAALFLVVHFVPERGWWRTLKTCLILLVIIGYAVSPVSFLSNLGLGAYNLPVDLVAGIATYLAASAVLDRRILPQSEWVDP